MTIGFFQPGTALGTFSTMMGSRKTVPPKMFRMVPFGDFHYGSVSDYLKAEVLARIPSSSSRILRMESGSAIVGGKAHTSLTLHTRLIRGDGSALQII